MKLSIIIFTLILIYNSVLSFVLISPNSCSDSKNNTMYGTFMIAYLSNILITTLILFFIGFNKHLWATLFAGVIEASYGWLFAASYTLYKDENTPDCLKRIAMATMVFASLFMILIPVAVYSFKKYIDINIIKFICGVETGKECDNKMATWYKDNVKNKIDKITNELKEKAKKKAEEKQSECDIYKQVVKDINENKKVMKKRYTTLSEQLDASIKNFAKISNEADRNAAIKTQEEHKPIYKKNIDELQKFTDELDSLIKSADQNCTPEIEKLLRKKTQEAAEIP